MITEAEAHGLLDLMERFEKYMPFNKGSSIGMMFNGEEATLLYEALVYSLDCWRYEE